MAVSTQSLKVRRIVVPPVTVFVVHIQLADVIRYKPALLTGIFLIDCIRVLVLNYVAFVDSLAPVPARQWVFRVSQFDLGGTTYGTSGSAFCLVDIRKFMVHLPSKERRRDYRS